MPCQVPNRVQVAVLDDDTWPGHHAQVKAHGASSRSHWEVPGAGAAQTVHTVQVAVSKAKRIACLMHAGTNGVAV